MPQPNAPLPARQPANPPGPVGLNRRRFLATAAAAAGAPWLLSARGQAAGTQERSGAKPAITPTVKLGIVGCGRRGRWIANLFREHGGYDLHAVADYFPNVAEQAGDALGVHKGRRFSGLSGYAKLIQSGVEAVALETPPYFFPEHARAAVDAGLHVYMAKPVAVDVPGCLAIDEAGKRAAAGGRCFLVDYQVPTDPHNREVVKRIRGGGLKQITLIDSWYLAGSFADPPLTDTIASRLRGLIWVNDVAIGGSYHVNACIHAVQAAMWIAGARPVAAVGESRRCRPDPHGDSRDIYSITYTFENGLIVHHRGRHVNDGAGFDVGCYCYGHGAAARIGYTGRAYVRGGSKHYGGGPIENLYKAGAQRNIDTFYWSIVRERFDNPTLRDGVDAALATILGREACRRRVRLTMKELLAENKRLEVDLTGLEA